jgi:cytochrome c oxidase subunit 2
MNAGQAWWLPEASRAASRVDLLFFTLLGLCGLVALGVAFFIVYFCIRYRKGSRADRSGPRLGRALEYTWIAVPLAIFIGIFAWGAVVYAGLYRQDPAAMTVYVVGKQWMWHIQHPNGRREINELHLPMGEPVRLLLATQDVIHSFFVPAFRIKQDAVPGRYTAIDFTPDREGVYRLHCAEYCGTDHARMIGRVIVMQREAFQRWLTAGDRNDDAAARGFELFRQHGCSGCHDARSSVHAPDLDGVLGRTVHLQDGRTVVADEGYIRDSILLPKKDVVAGYDDIMPSFKGEIGEDDLLYLLAYLKSRTGGPTR